MLKSHFTLSFETYGGEYFFPYNAATIKTALQDAADAETITTKDKDKADSTAKWPITKDVILKKNINRLMEHPKLQFLLQKKKDLILVFKSSGSKESREKLEKFMNILYSTLYSILEHAQDLYYLEKNDDFNKAVRSGYTFNECIEKAVDFGLLALKEKLIALNMLDPNVLTSALLLDENETNINKITNQLGGPSEQVMRKKGRPKKSKV